MHVPIAGGAPEVFGAMTGELHRLRDWLQERGVHSVAMESTGFYWLPLYSVLEAAGMEVQMVNGKKALERMNVKLHDVIGNLMGVCGLAVIVRSLARSKDTALGGCPMRPQPWPVHGKGPIPKD